MFPYGVRVVRTISIERANSGIVNRRDSGWQATSDGTYDIPQADPTIPQIVTHPGVVLGVSKVTNIRDINDPAHNLVNFDCTVQLESGSGTVDVPVRDQLGYIVTGITSVSGSTVSHNIPIPKPDDYAAILENHALGGPLDWVIDVGGSGLKSRITSVSISATNTNASSPKEFAMAAWGSPVLPEGQWSFTTVVVPRRPLTATEAYHWFDRDPVYLAPHQYRQAFHTAFWIQVISWHQQRKSNTVFFTQQIRLV
jgi:hypothetical protein